MARLPAHGPEGCRYGLVGGDPRSSQVPDAPPAAKAGRSQDRPDGWRPFALVRFAAQFRGGVTRNSALAGLASHAANPDVWAFARLWDAPRVSALIPFLPGQQVSAVWQGSPRPDSAVRCLMRSAGQAASRSPLYIPHGLPRNSRPDPSSSLPPSGSVRWPRILWSGSRLGGCIGPFKTWATPVGSALKHPLGNWKASIGDCPLDASSHLPYLILAFPGRPAAVDATPATFRAHAARRVRRRQNHRSRVFQEPRRRRAPSERIRFVSSSEFSGRRRTCLQIGRRL